MKVAICCIGRMENLYIREYCEHYQNIGVDTIFLFDNNYNGEEHFEDVIQDYIDSGFVKLINYRNKLVCQLDAYQDCSDTYGSEYDWMLFIDCDEYICMENFSSIKDFLSQEKYNNFDMIHINWLIYGDNDLVYYDNRKLKDRFTKPILPIDFKRTYKFPENNHIKSIIRCNKHKIFWKYTSHTPINENLKCCNVEGKEVDPRLPFFDFTFNGAYFKHYMTKTIEEWLNTKVKRGYPDINKNRFNNINNVINDFFSLNQITKEKIEYIKKTLNIKISYENS